MSHNLLAVILVHLNWLLVWTWPLLLPLPLLLLTYPLSTAGESALQPVTSRSYTLTTVCRLPLIQFTRADLLFNATAERARDEKISEMLDPELRVPVYDALFFFFFFFFFLSVQTHSHTAHNFNSLVINGQLITWLTWSSTSMSEREREERRKN